VSNRLSDDLVWYLRLGPSLPVRAIALLVWIGGIGWGGVNLLGVALNLLGAQFIKSVENGQQCSIPLWSALPRNAVLDFFPGTVPHGLISTVMIVLMNLALFGLSRWVLAYNPRVLSSAATGAGRGSLGQAVLVNLGAMLAGILIYAAALVVWMAAIAILFGGDSNTVDLMLPGTCSFLPYP